MKMKKFKMNKKMGEKMTWSFRFLLSFFLFIIAWMSTWRWLFLMENNLNNNGQLLAIIIGFRFRAVTHFCSWFF